MTDTQTTEAATAPETQEGTPPVQTETQTEQTEQSSVSIVEGEVEQQTTDTSEGSTETGAGSTEQEATQPEGAPEAYEDFTAPEGVDSLDADVLATYGDVAKELDLSQEQAQRMLDAVAPKMAARQEARLDEQAQAWANEAAADPEFGGANLKENVATARKAYQMGASDELKSLLKASRLDVHPEMLKMFSFFGKRLSEDKVVNEGDGAESATGMGGDVFNNPGKAMDAFYGKTKKK